MSLGGMTALALAGRRARPGAPPGAGRHHPGGDRRKAAAVTAFVDGPPSFASFDEILARTIEHNPTRSVSSLRRGILHNAVQREDGSWVWRYARFRPTDGAAARPEFVDLLGGRLRPRRCPCCWCGAWPRVGGRRRRRGRAPPPPARRPGGPGGGAGHSVQGDRPVELAAILSDFFDPGLEPTARRRVVVHAPRPAPARGDPCRCPGLRGAVRLAARSGAERQHAQLGLRLRVATSSPATPCTCGGASCTRRPRQRLGYRPPRGPATPDRPHRHPPRRGPARPRMIPSWRPTTPTWPSSQRATARPSTEGTSPGPRLRPGTPHPVAIPVVVIYH